MLALLFPFLLCCLIVHLLLPEPSLMSALQEAEFSEVDVSSGSKTLDWTMRHSFSAGIVALIDGRQSKMFAPDLPVPICTTLVAAVQFQPSPGQLGPA